MKSLKIGPTDAVVEFAPGRGATARLALEGCPAFYVGIDQAAAGLTSTAFENTAYETTDVRCTVGKASATGLDAASTSVVYGANTLAEYFTPVGTGSVPTS